MQKPAEQIPNLLPDCERLAQKLFSRRLRLDTYSPELNLLRFSVYLYEIEKFFLTEEESQRTVLLDRLKRLISLAPQLAAYHSDFIEYLEDTIAHLVFLSSQPQPERVLWRDQTMSAHTLAVPGMVSLDTMKFYRWLGGQLSGAGEVVEVGCWMGRSTNSLAEGLAKNRLFDGHFLHALDAFTWDEWLDNYARNHREEFSDEVRPALDALRLGSSYMDLFLGLCSPYKRFIKARSCYVYHDGKTGKIPALDWSGEPIELFIQDISSGSRLVQKVWDIVQPSFIPQKTVVVLQQYGHMRAEGLRSFCREKAKVLRPLHKPYGVAKAFLFTGGFASKG